MHMCRLRNIAMRDYQESVTTGQMDGQTDAGEVIPMCRYASQATQKLLQNVFWIENGAKLD